VCNVLRRFLLTNVLNVTGRTDHNVDMEPCQNVSHIRILIMWCKLYAVYFWLHVLVYFWYSHGSWVGEIPRTSRDLRRIRELLVCFFTFISNTDYIILYNRKCNYNQYKGLTSVFQCFRCGAEVLRWYSCDVQ